MIKQAYTDTSYLLGILFKEPGYRKFQERLESYDRIFSSNLLEAEALSALKREGLLLEPPNQIPGIHWIFPDRTLTSEFQTVLVSGYVRGADLWHLACALYLRAEIEPLEFLSLDKKQMGAARKLGLT